MSVFDLSSKLIRHPEVLTSIKHNIVPNIITARIYVTMLCDNNCKYCNVKEIRKKNTQNHMTADQFEKYAEILKDADCKSIILTGGEPVLNLEIADIIEIAKNLGFEVGLITNGQHFTQKEIKVVVDNCEWVRISFSAFTSQDYSSLRGIDRSKYFDVIANINDLILVKSESPNSNCEIGMQFIINQDYTKEKIEDFINTYFDKQLKGLDYMQIIPCQTTDKTLISRNNYIFSNLKDTFEVVKNVLSKQGKPTRVHYDKCLDAIELENNGFNVGFDNCFGCMLDVSIVPNGDCYFCCHHVAEPKFYAGNILNECGLIMEYDMIETIDKKVCPFLCKYYDINKTLEKTRKPIKHENFI